MTATAQQATPRGGGSLIQFDLSEHLTAGELQRFEQSAEAAGAPNLTEHFLNMTLRVPGQAGPIPVLPPAPPAGTVLLNSSPSPEPGESTDTPPSQG